MSRSLVTTERAAIVLALIGVTGHSVADIHCC
ncbi:Ms4533A family Cys-rich leader peptide [Streptomyces sp. 900116325]